MGRAAVMANWPMTNTNGIIAARIANVTSGFEGACIVLCRRTATPGSGGARYRAPFNASSSLPMTS